jgi:hypothetical protein
MTGLQNAKGPASVGALPDRGSTNPAKDQKMNSKIDSTGSAALPAPTIDGVHAGLLELISLIEDFPGEITFRQPDAEDRHNIARTQNLAIIAVHYARHVEASLDDFISAGQA